MGIVFYSKHSSSSSSSGVVLLAGNTGAAAAIGATPHTATTAYCCVNQVSSKPLYYSGQPALLLRVITVGGKTENAGLRLGWYHVVGNCLASRHALSLGCLLNNNIDY